MKKAQQKQTKLLLLCPYCSKKLTVTAGTTVFGVLTCDCDSYPIIESIPIILKTDTLVHKKLVELIKNHRTLKTVWVALSSQRFSHRIITFLVYLLFKKSGVLIPEKALYTLLYLIGPSRSWFKYLLNENRDTLQLVDQYITAKSLQATVHLEVGCGTGAFLSLLEKKSTQAKWLHIGIDKSFMSLLIAQMYRKHSQKLLICSDVESGIPLQKKSCHFVFVIDCFAWIYGKEKLIAESAELLKKRGAFYMFNVHEELEETKWWGYGISQRVLKKIALRYFETYKLISDKNKLGYSCVSQKK